MELGFPPQILDELPSELIEKMLLYKSVKQVVQYGGNWQP